MKFVRNPLQCFANGKKKEPREKEAQSEFNRLGDGAQSAAWSQIRRCHLCETGGAKHTVIVLGDAFTAEVSCAPRTPRRGFPSDVIETALVRQLGHV